MENLSYWGLFMSAFISSTVAPGGSEIVLVYMLTNHPQHIPLLISIATFGNTLGALTTWGLGMLAAKKYPLTRVLAKNQQQAVIWVTKWGYWALLFSWLPVIGDGFCFAGGWLRLSIVPAMLVIAVGKAMRYGAVVYLTLISG